MCPFQVTLLLLQYDCTLTPVTTFLDIPFKTMLIILLGNTEIQVQYSNNAISYQEPTINTQGEWELNLYDIEAIAIGAGILGTGGGFSPYIGKLWCQKVLAEGRKIRVVTPERFVHFHASNE